MAVIPVWNQDRRFRRDGPGQGVMANRVRGAGVQTPLLRLNALPGGKVVKDDPVLTDPMVRSSLRRRMTQQKNPEDYQADSPEELRYFFLLIILCRQGRAPMEGR
jgi:hypothetical protein